MLRWIMHVDMDAFFASVEQLDYPELAGKPVIVGGSSERSVVSTCSYEARKFGVHSAMSIVEARRLCPHGIFVPVRIKRYQEISAEIMNIFSTVSPVVEKLSIDEAFLDISGMENIYGDVRQAALLTKSKILKQTGLTASVGVAPNKFLAKMASDMQKPDGLTIIRHEDVQRTIKNLPVTKIFGIGGVACSSLKNFNINTIGELSGAKESILQKIFGRNWYTVKKLAEGIDGRPVLPHEQPKSVGREITLTEDIYDIDKCYRVILKLSEQVGFRLRKRGLSGHTVTVKVKYRNFKVHTRSITCENELCFDEDIYKRAVQLLQSIDVSYGVRLLGVTVSNLVFEQACSLGFEEDEKLSKRNKAIDVLKMRFGEEIIKRGSV